MSPHLSVALGEYDTGWHDSGASLAKAAKLVHAAATLGARVAILPEMATTGFTMDRSRAVPINGPDVAELRRMARASGIWIIAGVALQLEDDQSRVVNASLAIDPTGKLIAVHRKQRLFTYGHEHQTYTPGSASTRLTIDGARLGLFICYELRFPEVFAPIAEDVDAMVVIANWPKARQEHWDVLLRARAIENQCYVIGVNRTGEANGLAYGGGSVVFDPWGDRVISSYANDTRIVTIDLERVAAVRGEYPFLKDRHVYGD